MITLRSFRFKHFFKPILKCCLLLVPLVLVAAASSQSPPPEIDWEEGPMTADLGDNLAQVAVGGDQIFANGDDTRNLMDYFGNPPSGLEIGMIAPASQYEDWFILFEYESIGYVKDDEKEDLDADAILQSIKEGNEAANEIRAERGIPALRIVGWQIEPYYDPETNNLVWAILGREDGGSRVINYNTRLLGRGGYTAVVLVADPGELVTTLPKVESTIQEFSYKKGNRYSEFIEGDKIAQIGLTALVAGGAGAVAAKTGLLAKLWKFIAFGAMALFGVLAKFWRAIFRRGDQSNN